MSTEKEEKPQSQPASEESGRDPARDSCRRKMSTEEEEKPQAGRQTGNGWDRSAQGGEDSRVCARPWDRLASSAEKWRQACAEGEPRLQTWESAPSLCAEQRGCSYSQVLTQAVRTQATKPPEYQH